MENNFTVHVKEKDVVKAGQILAEFDKKRDRSARL